MFVWKITFFIFNKVIKKTNGQENLKSLLTNCISPVTSVKEVVGVLTQQMISEVPVAVTPSQ